jgi:hypothetical protein
MNNFARPMPVVPYGAIREAVIRFKRFPVIRQAPVEVMRKAFEERLERQVVYWQMAQIANGLTIRQLIRQIKESNLVRD